MVKPADAWKRFWCPPDGHVNLSDRGFLVDPEDPFGAVRNGDVLPWDTVSEKPCLILLGEPGIGKSSAMASERERMGKAVQGTEDQVLPVDLRRYQSDQRLHEHVFESAVVKNWKQGAGRLHLFFDSMDECLMRIENIGHILLAELSELPVERLSVRVACRSAVWPRNLERELRVLWGEENVGIYELAPLRRLDVVEAAKANGIEPPTSFVDSILQHAAVPLAIKPLTLQFLLNTYCRQGDLPATQANPYAEGCRLLCEEPREGLRPTRPSAELTAPQRLAVASRIAAATIFAARDAVWTEIDRGDVLNADIRISELVEGMAAYGSSRVEVTEDGIWQALNTGLFSSRGLPRIGWAHQTYSEFLAARFLIENGLSVDRIMSILVHPDGKIVPQLHETAAWLASMVPEVFRRIMSVDPEMLLWSDAATADAQDRMDLVENLLGLFDEGRLLDLDWDLRRRYQKLNHPRLSEQLGPYIRDKQKGVVVRRVAIHISEACGVKSLERDLIDISLGQTDVHGLRVSAAFTVSQWEVAASAQALRPLALGASGEDPDDDLKGCGLKCAWPNSLSAAELFTTLTPPKKRNRFGLYDSFLRQPIAEKLTLADLPIALAWVESEDQCGDSISPLALIADNVRARALQYFDDPAVAQALASATWKWLRTDGLYPSEQRAFTQALAADADRRRALALKMIPLIDATPNWPFYFFSARLLVPGDFNWLLERFDDATVEVQGPLLKLLELTFDDREPECGEALIAAARKHAILDVEFRWFLYPESSEAQAIRQHRAEREASTPKPRTTLVLDPPPQERSATVLARFESGDLGAFWQLNAELTLEIDSTHYSHWGEPSIVALPG